MQPSPRRPDETPAERAERWAAESALAKPRHKAWWLLDEAAPRVFAGLFLATMLGGIGFVVLTIAHRGGTGGTQPVGRVTAATCFEDDPGLTIPEGGSAAGIPTVDCADAHRAEAFLSFQLDGALGEHFDECESEWATQSDVPLEVSGVQIAYLTVGDIGAALDDEAICIAVGPEPVTGRELENYQPAS